MNKIESFKINHSKLMSGIYVSRKDYLGNEVLTTFDLGITAPNREPIMNIAEVHAMERSGVTFLRNKLENEIIYFGPMGYRTGFYLILVGDKEPEDIVDLIKELFGFTSNYESEIPNQSAEGCRNYPGMNLSMAKFYFNRYLNVINNVKKKNLIYSE